MARQRTTKSIASRIELDYYKKRHPLRTWRLRLAAAAFVLPFVLLGGLAASGTRSAWSPGPLAPGHAPFADDCQQCHGKGRGDGEIGPVSDRACSHCHEGGLHVADDKRITRACASCHREHVADRADERTLGSIARPDDAHCTQCHAQPVYGLAAVTDFASHPEFALHRGGDRDPGTIALDHQLHLSLVRPDIGRPLACVDCHALGADGKSMAPIEFEQHCARCHALELGGETDGALTGAALTHGLAPAALREQLRSIALVRAPPTTPAAEVSAWVDRTVREAEQYLAATRCAECHAVERDAAGLLATIAPAGVPSRWFARARFDHHVHRANDCAECHHDVASSRATSDLHLPRLADCARCHGEEPTGALSTGARSDCVECHAYHPQREAMRAGR